MSGTAGGLGVGVAAVLRRLDAEAAALASVPLEGIDGHAAEAARRTLRGVIDRLGLVSAALLARVEADGRWAAAGGARDVPQWSARRDGVSYGAARREVTLGRAVDPVGPLAATRAAVVAGEITLEHAQVLADLGPTSDARRAALASDLADRNEASLLAHARRLPVDDFRRVVRRWAATVDDAAAEREHRAAGAREHLSLSRRRDGLALSGFLTHEHGELLTTALRAVEGVPARDDERGPDQRLAAALTGAARLVLERGLAGEGALVRPHLSVHVSYEALERLTAEAAVREDRERGEEQPVSRRRSGLEPRLTPPAELDSGVPLAPSVLERLVCDSEVSRVVFGPSGEVLDVGRAQRSYTKQLRRAVVARERTCAYPGCSAPPNLGEVHHVRWWSRGGETSAENGVLLCWYHHDLVHQRGLRIARRPFGWEFRRPDGSPLRDGRWQGRRDSGPPDRDAGPPDRGVWAPDRDVGPPDRDAGPPDRGVWAPDRDVGPPDRDVGALGRHDLGPTTRPVREPAAGDGGEPFDSPPELRPPDLIELASA